MVGTCKPSMGTCGLGLWPRVGGQGLVMAGTPTGTLVALAGCQLGKAQVGVIMAQPLIVTSLSFVSLCPAAVGSSLPPTHLFCLLLQCVLVPVLFFFF